MSLRASGTLHPRASVSVRFGRAPGCVWARRAAHSWPGRRARRAPLRAAGCAGPERSELGEEPGPVAGALPVIGLLCCNFSRALREACARPSLLPQASLRFLGSPGGDRTRLGGLSLSGGLFGSCIPGGRWLREDQPRSSESLELMMSSSQLLLQT